MTTDGEREQVMRLLELLASDAPLSTIASVDAPRQVRDLALRVGTAREEHRRREAAQSALLDTARELASEQEPHLVLDAIVRRARALLGTDLAYLTLYDPEMGDTYMRATDGSVSAEFQSVRLSLGDGLGGLVAKTRKPYWTADYGSDRRFHHTRTIDSAVGDEGIVAICGTPLIVESEFVGVLFAANRSPRPFSRPEVGLLGTLGALAAVALLRTRALAEARQALAALSEAHETVRQQAAGVSRAAAAHDRFASVILAGGGTDDVTQTLGDLLGGWAVLLDADGERRSWHGPAPSPGPGGEEPLLATAVVERGREEAGRIIEHAGMHAVGVIASREHLGTLVVGGQGPLDEADQRTVERAAVVTALVLLFERQADDARQSARNRVLGDLVAARGSVHDREEYLRDAGIDVRVPMCVLVVCGGSAEQQRSIALSVSSALGDGVLVGTHEDEVVVVAASTTPEELARTLVRRLTGGPRITVGASGRFTGVDQLPARHEEASRTARSLIALGRAGVGAASAELGFAGLIVGSDPDVSAYVRATLGPVLDYDTERGTDLVETIEEYFAAGSSPRHAAIALHVHVNTVAQRLGRVSALLGDTWQRPDRALEVQLALRLRRLVEAPS